MSAERKYIFNLTRGSVICEKAVIADQALHRMRGLLGRSSFPAGEGLLLKPAPSIHTALMRFPIDALFLTRDLRVIKVVQHLAPWRAASARRARAVLELAAGEVAHRGVEIGDILRVVDRQDSQGAIADEPGAAGRSIHEVGQPGGGPREQTRVLIVTPDSRFRALASVLLERRGCAVSLGDRLTGVAELAERDAADVVLLDASASLAAAAREAADIEALEPCVPVVMVAEQAAHGVAAMLVLPKWGSFDALYSTIEDARGRVDRRYP